jgi:peptidoglycan/LPS O-acetylase OafA/YrhL
MCVHNALSWTIEARLEQAGGITSGFDYMRIALAMSVVCWHSLLIAFGLDVDALTPQATLRAFGCLILPMFFALSGFLVAGSLLRANSILEFALLRVL